MSWWVFTQHCLSFLFSLHFCLASREGFRLCSTNEACEDRLATWWLNYYFCLNRLTQVDLHSESDDANPVAAQLNYKVLCYLAQGDTSSCSPSCFHLFWRARGLACTILLTALISFRTNFQDLGIALSFEWKHRRARSTNNHFGLFLVVD